MIRSNLTGLPLKPTSALRFSYRLRIFNYGRIFSRNTMKLEFRYIITHNGSTTTHA